MCFPRLAYLAGSASHRSPALFVCARLLARGQEMIRQQTLWRSSPELQPAPAETTARQGAAPRGPNSSAESQGWLQLHWGCSGRRGRKSRRTPQLLEHCTEDGVWLSQCSPRDLLLDWTPEECSAPLQGEGQDDPAAISPVPRSEEAAVPAQQPCRHSCPLPRGSAPHVPLGFIRALHQTDPKLV